MAELSPTMESCLRHARRAGFLVRLDGGFWVSREGSGDQGDSYFGEEPYFGTQTVEALRKRGLLVAHDDYRVLVPARGGRDV